MVHDRQWSFLSFSSSLSGFSAQEGRVKGEIRIGCIKKNKELNQCNPMVDTCSFFPPYSFLSSKGRVSVCNVLHKQFFLFFSQTNDNGKEREGELCCLFAPIGVVSPDMSSPFLRANFFCPSCHPLLPFFLLRCFTYVVRIRVVHPNVPYGVFAKAVAKKLQGIPWVNSINLPRAGCNQERTSQKGWET